MQKVEKTLKIFLKKHLAKTSGPPLLALSGGPDSRALFHLLLETQVPFHAAHVNHGWRVESLCEEETLIALCADHKIPLYIKRLSFSAEDKNMEDKARQARLAFYRTLSPSAVLLAHHADDQAETVLKRIFEGATLPRLKGLSEVSHVEGLTLWRPLLTLRKDELLQWLHAKQIPYFTDVTNLDPRFLRGRFRKELFPLLSQTFGKEIVASLSRLATSAEELHEFLEGMLRPYRERVEHKEGEVSLDLGREERTSFEAKMVIKDFFASQGLSVSAPLVETIYGHVRRGKGKRELRVGARRVVVGGGSINLLKVSSFPSSS